MGGDKRVRIGRRLDANPVASHFDFFDDGAFGDAPENAIIFPGPAPEVQPVWDNYFVCELDEFSVKPDGLVGGQRDEETYVRLLGHRFLQRCYYVIGSW